MARRVHLIMYSKSDCHLCEEMKKEIRLSGCDELYTLEEVNIESDTELLARYRSDIPVLLMDGVEAFHHRLTSADFKTKLTEHLR